MTLTPAGAVPAGWYPNPNDPATQRYWDGTAWTEHHAPASGRRVQTDAERSQIVQSHVAAFSLQGWSVTSQTFDQAVLQRKARIGWFWNGILTIITAGLWLIVVIIRVVNRRIETRIIRVNEYGELY